MTKDYTKLIYKTAWSFQMTTEIDFDEFVSLGFLVWAECLKNYDAERNTPFYAYLKQSLFFDFSLFYKKVRRKGELDKKIIGLPKPEAPSIERLFDFKEKLNNLSKASQRIVKAIFAGDIGNNTTLRRYHVKDYFRKMGYTHLRIQKCFQEITNIL